jgi:hypothetical protein
MGRVVRRCTMSSGPAMPNDDEAVDTDYEEEIEAERTGKSAEEIEADRRADERDPLDEAYQPRSG